MSPIGTSRRFAAPQNSVAIEGIADIGPGSPAPMTLGNMCANGVRTLVAWCLGRACNCLDLRSSVSIHRSAKRADKVSSARARKNRRREPAAVL